MYRFLLISAICVIALCFARCQRGSETGSSIFDSTPSILTVQPTIDEVSGIADSKLNSGFIWAQEDGGNPAELHLVSHDGDVFKKVFIKGATNRDWEDIVLSGNDIFIGDIGDNNGVHPECRIYKFPEPLISVDTVRVVETIRFQYADGPRDAEAFLVDPSSKAIYVITKRDSPSRIYKLTPPFTQTTNIADFVGELRYGGVVSAAISLDGKEIIVKTYGELGYYKLKQGEKIEAALSKTPTLIPYIAETQGEAVCFSANNQGYYTLSERGQSADVKLYFYKRK